MTPEELAAIRERDARMDTGLTWTETRADRRALLAHIDAITELAAAEHRELDRRWADQLARITEAVEGLPHISYDEVYVEGERSPLRIVDMDAVLALLRGTPQ